MRNNKINKAKQWEFGLIWFGLEKVRNRKKKQKQKQQNIIREAAATTAKSTFRKTFKIKKAEEEEEKIKWKLKLLSYTTPYEYIDII